MKYTAPLENLWVIVTITGILSLDQFFVPTWRPACAKTLAGMNDSPGLKGHREFRSSEEVPLLSGKCP